MDYEICGIQDIPANGAKGFSINTDRGRRELFIVRKNGKLYGYINRCPHTGINLEWKPDHFLDSEGALIQCSNHGALFRIEDGYCIHGPCRGDSLKPVMIHIEGNKLLLKHDSNVTE